MIINEFVIFSKTGLDFFNFSEHEFMDPSLLAAYITAIMANINEKTASMDEFCGVTYLDPERTMSAGFTVYEGKEIYGACSYYTQGFSLPSQIYYKHILSAEKNYLLNPRKGNAIELDKTIKMQIELELTSDCLKRTVYEKQKHYYLIPFVWQKHQIDMEKGKCKTVSKILPLPKSLILKNYISAVVRNAKKFEQTIDESKIRVLSYTRDIAMNLSTNFTKEYLSENEKKPICYGIIRGIREKGYYTELDIWIYDPGEGFWEGCYCGLFDLTFEKTLLNENTYEVFEVINELKTKFVSFPFVHKDQKLRAILIQDENINIYPLSVPIYCHLQNNKVNRRILIVQEENCKIISNFIYENELDLDKIEKEDLNEFLPPKILLEKFICKPNIIYITSPRKRLDHKKLLEISKKIEIKENNDE